MGEDDEGVKNEVPFTINTTFAFWTNVKGDKKLE